MAEINERPSKIRKLDVSEDTKSIPEVSSPRDKATNPKEESHSEPTDSMPEQAENRQAQIQETPALSKSALKKLRKAEAWAAGKEYRKERRREKHKEKQARKAEERAEFQQKVANGEIQPAERPTLETGRPKRPIQVPVALIMDCDFNEFMTEKEIISLGAQLTRCYSENRSAKYRTHFAVSSWSGVLKSRFENVLANTHLQWKGVRFYDQDFESAAKAEDVVMRTPTGGKVIGALSKEVIQTSLNAGDNLTAAADEPTDCSMDQAPTLPMIKEDVVRENRESNQKPIISTNTLPQPGQLQRECNLTQSSDFSAGEPAPSIVYLTSDSPHTLTELSPYTSYIIGGIVDKNRHKGICYKRAQERGIPTAKLPIGEFMTMQSRSVLAINHVVEIMLKWLETGNWGEAFLSVIPKRKEAKLKQKKGENDVDGNDYGREEYERDDDDGDNDENSGGASLIEKDENKLENE